MNQLNLFGTGVMKATTSCGAVDDFYTGKINLLSLNPAVNPQGICMNGMFPIMAAPYSVKAGVM